MTQPICGVCLRDQGQQQIVEPFLGFIAYARWLLTSVSCPWLLGGPGFVVPYLQEDITYQSSPNKDELNLNTKKRFQQGTEKIWLRYIDIYCLI